MEYTVIGFVSGNLIDKSTAAYDIYASSKLILDNCTASAGVATLANSLGACSTSSITATKNNVSTGEVYSWTYTDSSNNVH